VIAGLSTLAALLALALMIGGPVLAVRESRLRTAAQNNETRAVRSEAEAKRQRDRARGAANQFFVDVSTNPRLLVKEQGTQDLRR
jgi:hypothetical protein